MASISDAAISPSVRGRDETSNWISCPVNPAWVLEGNPVARIEHLSSSADGSASTYFWDCTAGRFNWFYNFDETLHILEGSVTLKFSDRMDRRALYPQARLLPHGAAGFFGERAGCSPPRQAPGARTGRRRRWRYVLQLTLAG